MTAHMRIETLMAVDETLMAVVLKMASSLPKLSFGG
jgi:hypothetical protein